MDRKLKKKLLRACKVGEPVPPGDPRHFDFDAEGLKLRGRPWRDQVVEVIDLSDEPTWQLVTGSPGSGKSTELQQLRSDLEELGCRAVLADAGAWIRDDAPITVEDILLSLVLALYPDGKPQDTAGWVKEYAQQAWEFLQSEVKVEDLEAGVDVLKVKAKLVGNTTLFQQVAKRLHEVKGLHHQIFKLLGDASEAAEAEGHPLVILLDGIEKRATGDLWGPEEREKFRNRWFGAFLTQARDLQPPVHVVYTVPPFMVRRAAQLGAMFGHELQFLPMVRVFEQKARDDGRPALHVDGVCAMRDALFKRVSEEHFDSSQVAAWLAVHSGGYMRDLLRLVSDCIYRNRGEKITRELAEAAVDQVRQTYLEGWEAADAPLLSRVHENKEFPLDEQNRARMDSLLQGYMMLRYHNSKHWYDAHPLIWPRIGVEGPTWEEVAAACP